jgi:hypothetical protein
VATTEARLNQLYNRVREVLGADEAETMMEAMREGMRSDLATKADVGSVREELHAVEQRMTRTFVTWMLTSQAAFTAIIAVFFSLAT